MQIRVAFIGAGGINFGTPEGPWNHSARLQLLPDVTFSAIVDPNGKLAQERIDTLQKGLGMAQFPAISRPAVRYIRLQSSADLQESMVISGKILKSFLTIKQCWRMQTQSQKQPSLACRPNIMAL